MSFNCCTISNKTQIITDYIHTQHIDVALLQETRHRNIISCIGYKSFHLPYSDNCHGLIIFARAELKPRLVSTTSADNIHTITIMITHPNIHYITNIYIPPIRDRQFPTQAVHELLFRDTRHIIGGDFNAMHQDWSVRTNPYGRALRQCIEHTNMKIKSTPNPTRENNTIDFFITSTDSITQNPITLDDLLSDHLPIQIILSIHTQYSEEEPKKIIPPWLLTKLTANINKDMTQYIPPQHATNIELNRAALELTNLITRNIEQLEVPVKYNTNHTKLSNITREALRYLRKLRRMYRATRLPILRHKIETQKQTLQQLIERDKTLNWSHKLMKLEQDEKQLYQTVRYLSRETPAPASIIELDGTTYCTDKAQADILCDTLQSQFSPWPIQTPHLLHVRYKQHYNKLENTNTSLQIPPITIADTLNIIKCLKKNKAPGPDKIRAEHLQHLPLSCITQLTRLYNLALYLCAYPQTWKHSHIVTIPKPGKDPRVPNNRRPISLISNLAKVFDKYTIQHFRNALTACGIPDDRQAGFRKGHATTHQIANVIQKMMNHARDASPGILVTLDFSQAFDRVHWPSLLWWLNRRNLDTTWQRWLLSYLSGRTFQVKIGTTLGKTGEATASVPQGSLYGPTVFSAMIHFLPQSDNTTTYLYADDVALISTGPHACEHANLALEEIYEWCGKIRAQLNPNKCTVTPFGRRRNSFTGQVRIHNTILQNENAVKYLGFWIDNNLSFRTHLSSLRAKTRRRISMVRAMSKSTNIKLKTKVFTSIVRPTYEYCAPILACGTKTEMLQLQAIIMEPLKHLLDVPRWFSNTHICREIGIEHPIARIQQMARTFLERCSTSQERIPLTAVAPPDLELHPLRLRHRDIARIWQEMLDPH